MDIRGYLNDSVTRFKVLMQLQSLRDRLTISPCILAEFVPNTFRAIRLIDHLVRHITTKSLIGSKMSVNGVTYFLRDLGSLRMLQERWELWMHNYLKPRQGSVFIDVGANIGRYSLQFSRRIGSSGRIVAIEPVPETFSVLARAVKANNFQNITLMNIACWNREIDVDLFIASHSGSSSIKRNFDQGFVTVKAKTLDSVVEELGLSRVDFVKIDAEAAELEILQGMRAILNKYRPRIIGEIWAENEKAVLDLMEKYNYNCRLIEETQGGANSYYYLEPGDVSFRDSM